MKKESVVEKFYYVTEEKAKENPAYWQLMQSVFKKQKPIDFSKPADPENIGHIVEQEGKKYVEHAEHIKKNEWLKLDVSDPYFLSNLFKALRLNLINLSELSTAQKIYGAPYELRNLETGEFAKISQYHLLDTKGPYDVKSITYASPEKIEKFKEKLKKLPENQQCYFAVEFSLFRQIHHVDWLLTQLIETKHNKFSLEKNLITLFKNCVDKISPVGLGEKSYWRRKLEQEILTGKDLLNLNKFIITSKFKDFYYSFKYEEDNESADFLRSILAVEEKMPAVVFSEALGKLFFIFLSDEALVALSQAVHGEDATQLVYNVGGFGLRDLLNATAQGVRPVELMHRNILATPIVHACQPRLFMHHWHDLFHAWRNAANMHRKGILYIVNLLIQIKGPKISSPIFRLLDLDASTGWRLRELVRLIESGEKLDQSYIDETYFIGVWSIIKKAFSQEEIDAEDLTEHNLILIFDMVENDRVWRDFFTPECTRAITDRIPALKESSYFYQYLFKSDEEMNTILKKVVEIISDTPGESTLHRILYYSMEEYHVYLDPIVKTCNSLNIQLEDLLMWYPSRGMYFVKTKQDVGEFSSRDITKNLLEVVFNSIHKSAQLNEEPSIKYFLDIYDEFLNSSSDDEEVEEEDVPVNLNNTLKPDSESKNQAASGKSTFNSYRFIYSKTPKEDITFNQIPHLNG